MKYRELTYRDLKISVDSFPNMFDLSENNSAFYLSELNEIISEASDWIFPKITVQKFNKIEIGKDNIKIGETTLQTGIKIAKQFVGADSIIVFVCTVGNGPVEKYQLYSKQNDPLRAYFADALGSIAVEKSMDMFQSAMNREEKTNYKTLSNRYSPGYCGWNIAEQRMLFSLFPPEPSGVSLNQSCLMQPIKSISGIIGVGDNLVMTEHSCQLCGMKKCIYNKRKKEKQIS